MKRDKKVWVLGLVVALVLVLFVMWQMGGSSGITSLSSLDSNTTSEEPRYVDPDLPIWMK